MLKAEIKTAQDTLKATEKKRNQSFVLPTNIEQEIERQSQEVSNYQVKLLLQRKINEKLTAKLKAYTETLKDVQQALDQNKGQIPENELLNNLVIQLKQKVC